MNKTTLEEVLSIMQASKILKVDVDTVCKWAKTEKIPASKIGKNWYFLRADIDAFLKRGKSKTSFLSELQLAELVTALKGRKEIPQKFAYLGSGADKWVEYSNTPAYILREEEISLLRTNSKKIFTAIKQKQCNMLDLGCGDGSKARLILNEFGIDKYATGYFPLDISTRMIEYAIKENADLLSKNRVIETFNEDFENGSIASATYYLRRRYYKNNFIMFLGQTLGNCSDAHRVLANLRDGMSTEDNLLVGVALNNGKFQSAQYNTKEAHEQLWQIPLKYGIKKQDASMTVKYNYNLNQFEDHMHFKKSKTIKLGDEKVYFKKGDKILMDTSKRFSQNELIAIFHGARLKIDSLFINKEKDYSLVLCKPFT